MTASIECVEYEGKYLGGGRTMRCSKCRSDDISILEMGGFMFCDCRACGHKWREIKPKKLEYIRLRSPGWTFDSSNYPLKL